MNKIQLGSELKNLGITVVGNKIKKSDIIKIARASLTELNKFKVNENNDWTIYKIPNDVESVDGVSAKDTYAHLCAGTQWQLEEFWNQFKAMNPKELFVYVSKTRNITDTKCKLATLDGNVYVGTDEQQVIDINTLNLPPLTTDVIPSTGDKCTCDIFELMRNGCKCGAMQSERNKTTSSLITKKQLKNQLYTLNIPVYAGCKIKKKDIQRALSCYDKKKVNSKKSKIEAVPTIPLDFVKKVIEAIKNKLKTSKEEPNFEKLNSFIKKNTPGDLMTFAKSAIDYFKQGKLKWENEFGLLQNEYTPGGYEVIPWSLLKRELDDLSPEIEKTLPKAFVQKLA